jgi:hypothetical protein
MRASLFLTLLLVFLCTVRAQTFETVPSDSVYTTLHPNASAELTIYWRNSSAQSISLSYQEISVSYPAGWIVQICDVNACFPMPHPQGSTWPFASGDSSFLKISVIPNGIPGSALFCYEVTDPVDGYSSTVCMAFDATLTSTMELDMEKEVKIFPNPADATLCIAAGGQNLKAGRVELLKADGTVASRWSVHHASFQEWDVSTLAAGCYRLIYSTPTGRISRNVLIAR